MVMNLDSRAEADDDRENRVNVSASARPGPDRRVCQTWDEFVARVRSAAEARTVWYRGHRNAAFKLSSLWERRLLDLREMGSYDAAEQETAFWVQGAGVRYSCRCPRFSV